MIKVDNLVKKYGHHAAVDHLSFEVPKGQIYGFLGANGAGKTTTMNMITGYLAATEGTIEICGADMLMEPEKAKRHIGYLPEVPPLYPDMTVFEYLHFVAELKKVPKSGRREQVQEIMRLTGLTDVESRLIKNLSRGYRQRTGLAQAMIGYPEVMILDEPMAGLDPREILEIRTLLQKLAGEHTILLSSHILSEVDTICDHIIILAEGRLIAGDSPEGLRKRIKKSVEIEMTAQGSREKAEELLAGIAHIRSCVFEKAPEDGCIQMRILTEGGTDIRSALSVAFTSHDMPVLSMSRVEKSLEDIFLQLTQMPEKEEAEDGGNL
ncbi:MAG: ABC transporter ATP-binding protein [Blautia sp.]|nr:ABC transporter ATP-binding protein [Blautia sp.]MCM1200615.1 ABC transporter ATP-binding protein [Bacteroides fragilis]